LARLSEKSGYATHYTSTCTALSLLVRLPGFLKRFSLWPDIADVEGHSLAVVVIFCGVQHEHHDDREQIGVRIDTDILFVPLTDDEAILSGFRRAFRAIAQTADWK
jgi:hypothetical protein